MNDRDLILSAGGPKKLAKICGISPQAVSQWKSNGIPRSVRNLLAFYVANHPDIKKIPVGPQRTEDAA